MKKIKFNRLFLGAVVFAAASAFSLTGMSAQASMIYINSSSKWDTSKGLSVRPSGNVYNADGKLVGHLTDVDGKAIKSIPGSGDYEIQTRSGKILASSNAAVPGIDSARSMQINDGSEENSKGGLNNPSMTTATSNSMNSSGANNNAGTTAAQAASDKGAVSTMPNNSGSGTSGDTARIPAAANTGSTTTTSSPGTSSTGTTTAN